MQLKRVINFSQNEPINKEDLWLSKINGLYSLKIYNNNQWEDAVNGSFLPIKDMGKSLIISTTLPPIDDVFEKDSFGYYNDTYTVRVCLVTSEKKLYYAEELRDGSNNKIIKLTWKDIIYGIEDDTKVLKTLSDYDTWTEVYDLDALNQIYIYLYDFVNNGNKKYSLYELISIISKLYDDVNHSYLENFVRKDGNKQLSTQDFTTQLKTKLDALLSMEDFNTKFEFKLKVKELLGTKDDDNQKFTTTEPFNIQETTSVYINGVRAFVDIDYTIVDDHTIRFINYKPKNVDVLLIETT